MALIDQLRRGRRLGPLALPHVGLRRPRRDVDREVDQEVHGSPGGRRDVGHAGPAASTRPGSRVVTSWTSHTLPSGSLKEKNDW